MSEDLFSFAEEHESQETTEDIREKYLRDAEQKIVAMRDDPNMDIDDADVRFSTSLPLHRVRNATVAIVGAGGLGNSQWDVILGMGFRHVAIFDDDTVGIENIGSQGHSIIDIGRPKVEAIRQKALLYRGVNIEAVQERVQTFGQIAQAIGYVPDIVITCTDSADFRRDFFNWFVDSDGDLKRTYNQMPLLWLDYRMSLGDWTCYAIPLRLMTYGYSMLNDRTVRQFMNGYRAEAIFSEEQAVHESCTERGIIYTPKACAAYTGAYLHWFYTEFRPKFPMDPENAGADELEAAGAVMRDWLDCKLQMQHKVTFSARDWEFITETKREENLRRTISKLNAEIESLENTIDVLNEELSRKVQQPAQTSAEPEAPQQPEQTEEGEEKIEGRHISWEELRPGDVVLFEDLEGEDGECCTIQTVSPMSVVADYAGVKVSVNVHYGRNIRLLARVVQDA